MVPASSFAQITVSYYNKCYHTMQGLYAEWGMFHVKHICIGLRAGCGKAKNEPASKLRRDGKSPLSVFTSGYLKETTSRVA
jgi:hypothetical protein